MNEDLYNGIFEGNIKRGIKTGIITITDGQLPTAYRSGGL